MALFWTQLMRNTLIYVKIVQGAHEQDLKTGAI
jgi:hypothetical protein